MKSKDRWGFLKGVSKEYEEPEDTAIREFREESSIKVDKKDFESFFIQKNELKNIGIYLLNYNKIKDIDKYFDNEVLFKKYISLENSDVRFFDIDSLPPIKKKQKYLIKEVIENIVSSK